MHSLLGRWTSYTIVFYKTSSHFALSFNKIHGHPCQNKNDSAQFFLSESRKQTENPVPAEIITLTECWWPESGLIILVNLVVTGQIIILIGNNLALCEMTWWMRLINGRRGYLYLSLSLSYAVWKIFTFLSCCTMKFLQFIPTWRARFSLLAHPTTRPWANLKLYYPPSQYWPFDKKLEHAELKMSFFSFLFKNIKIQWQNVKFSSYIMP